MPTKEQWRVMTINIPRAFIHADINELIHVCPGGTHGRVVDPSWPWQVSNLHGRGKRQEGATRETTKRLYGTLQGALLLWQKLTEFLTEELGFTVNPYDRCVVNKIINGKQCTIIWHVDDLKLLHVKQEVLEDISEKLNSHYSKEVPLTVHHGTVQPWVPCWDDYWLLWEKGKVKFLMPDYIEGILEEALEDMGVGISSYAGCLQPIHGWEWKGPKHTTTWWLSYYTYARELTQTCRLWYYFSQLGWLGLMKMIGRNW